MVKAINNYEVTFTTGTMSVENNKQNKCFVCSWSSDTLHILTITSRDSLTCTRIPLCKNCALEIAEELLTSINEIN